MPSAHYGGRATSRKAEPWPLLRRFIHHAMPLHRGGVSLLRPTEDEAKKGIVQVQVNVGYCRHPECGNTYYFVKYVYRDGTVGEEKRLKRQAEVAAMTKRLHFFIHHTIRAQVRDWRSGVWLPPTEIPVS